MKHLLIVNPAAGSCDKTEPIRAAAEQVFGSRGLSWELQVSQGPGHCKELARQAAETGEDLRIYACGGDGTLNEVVNGVVGFENAAVTHYPAGSGNDFIKIFDQPEAFRDLERLLDGEEGYFDLIRCQDESRVTYSVNICSVGLDARIGTGIGKYRRLPLVSGKCAYLLSLVENLFKGLHRPYEVEVNGERISGNQTLIAVCSGRHYGGSFHPMPDAEPDDGLLDVLIVKPVNLLQVAQVIGRYQKGRYAELPHLIRALKTREIRIISGGSVINADGEALHSSDMTFSVEERKLRFFYPAGLRYRSKESKREEIGAI